MPRSAGHRHKDTSVTFDHSCRESSGSSGPAAAPPNFLGHLRPPGTGSLLHSEMEGLKHLPQTPKQPENRKAAPSLPSLGPEIQAMQSWEHTQWPLFFSELEGPRNHTVQERQDLPGHTASASSERGGPACVPLQPSLRRRVSAVSPSPCREEPPVEIGFLCLSVEQGSLPLPASPRQG